MRTLLAGLSTALFFFCAALPAYSFDEASQRCMAEAMYFEARGEGWRGMLAVGVVIQNRVRHPDYPNTVCAVVRQGRYWGKTPIKHKCQFSYWCDGKPEEATDEDALDQALDLAKTLLSSNLKLVGIEDATHYHATYVQPPWTKILERRDQIGAHIFYAKLTPRRPTVLSNSFTNVGGVIMDQEPCTHCNGTGVVRVKYATESDEEEFFCPVCTGAGVPLSHYSTDSVKLKK